MAGREQKDKRQRIKDILARADLDKEYGLLEYAIAELKSAAEPSTTALQNTIAGIVRKRFEQRYQQYIDKTTQFYRQHGMEPLVLPYKEFFERDRTAYLDVLNEPLDLSAVAQKMLPKSGVPIGKRFPRAFGVTTVGGAMSWLVRSEIPGLLETIAGRPDRENVKHGIGRITRRSPGSYPLEDLTAGMISGFETIHLYDGSAQFTRWYNAKVRSGIDRIREYRKADFTGPTPFSAIEKDDEGAVDSFRTGVDAALEDDVVSEGSIERLTSGIADISRSSSLPARPPQKTWGQSRTFEDFVSRITRQPRADIFGNYSTYNVSTGRYEIETKEEGPHGRTGVSAWLYGLDPQDVRVVGVDPNSPLAKAGVREGSIIRGLGEIIHYPDQAVRSLIADELAHREEIGLMVAQGGTWNEEMVNIPLHPQTGRGIPEHDDFRENWIDRLAQQYDLSSITEELYTTDPKYASGVYKDEQGNWHLAPISNVRAGKFNVPVEITRSSASHFARFYDQYLSEWKELERIYANTENKAREFVVAEREGLLKTGQVPKVDFNEALRQKFLELLPDDVPPPSEEFLEWFRSGHRILGVLQRFQSSVTGAVRSDVPDRTIDDWDALMSSGDRPIDEGSSTAARAQQAPPDPEAAAQYVQAQRRIMAADLAERARASAYYGGRPLGKAVVFNEQGEAHKRYPAMLGVDTPMPKIIEGQWRYGLTQLYRAWKGIQVSPIEHSQPAPAQPEVPAVDEPPISLNFIYSGTYLNIPEVVEAVRSEQPSGPIYPQSMFEPSEGRINAKLITARGHKQIIEGKLARMTRIADYRYKTDPRFRRWVERVKSKRQQRIEFLNRWKRGKTADGGRVFSEDALVPSHKPDSVEAARTAQLNAWLSRRKTLEQRAERILGRAKINPPLEVKPVIYGWEDRPYDTTILGADPATEQFEIAVGQDEPLVSGKRQVYTAKEPGRTLSLGEINRHNKHRGRYDRLVHSLSVEEVNQPDTAIDPIIAERLDYDRPYNIDREIEELDERILYAEIAKIEGTDYEGQDPEQVLKRLREDRRVLEDRLREKELSAENKASEELVDNIDYARSEHAFVEAFDLVGDPLLDPDAPLSQVVSSAGNQGGFLGGSQVNWTRTFNEYSAKEPDNISRQTYSALYGAEYAEKNVELQLQRNTRKFIQGGNKRAYMLTRFGESPDLAKEMSQAVRAGAEKARYYRIPLQTIARKAKREHGIDLAWQPGREAELFDQMVALSKEHPEILKEIESLFAPVGEQARVSQQYVRAIEAQNRARTPAPAKKPEQAAPIKPEQPAPAKKPEQAAPAKPEAASQARTPQPSRDPYDSHIFDIGVGGRGHLKYSPRQIVDMNPARRFDPLTGELGLPWHENIQPPVAHYVRARTSEPGRRSGGRTGQRRKVGDYILDEEQSIIYYPTIEGPQAAKKLERQSTHYLTIPGRKRFDLILPYNKAEDESGEALEKLLTRAHERVSAVFGEDYDVGAMRVVNDPNLPPGLVRIGAFINDPDQREDSGAPQPSPEDYDRVMREEPDLSSAGNFGDDEPPSPPPPPDAPSDNGSEEKRRGPNTDPAKFPMQPEKEGWRMTFTQYDPQTQRLRQVTAWSWKRGDNLGWYIEKQPGVWEELQVNRGAGRVYDERGRLIHDVSYADATRYHARQSFEQWQQQAEGKGEATPSPARTIIESPEELANLQLQEGWMLQVKSGDNTSYFFAGKNPENPEEIVWLYPQRDPESPPVVAKNAGRYGKVYDENDQLIANVSERNYIRWQHETGQKAWYEKDERERNTLIGKRSKARGEEEEEPKVPNTREPSSRWEPGTPVTYTRYKPRFSARAYSGAPVNIQFSEGYNNFAEFFDSEMRQQFIDNWMATAEYDRTDVREENDAYMTANAEFNNQVLAAWEYFGSFQERHPGEDYNIIDVLNYLQRRFGGARSGRLRLAAEEIMAQKFRTGGKWTEVGRLAHDHDGVYYPVGFAPDETVQAFLKRSQKAMNERIAAKLSGSLHFDTYSAFVNRAYEKGLGRYVVTPDGTEYIVQDYLNADKETGEVMEIRADMPQMQTAIGFIQSAYGAAVTSPLPATPNEYMATLKKRVDDSIYRYIDAYVKGLEKAGSDPDTARQAGQKIKDLVDVALDTAYGIVDEELKSVYGIPSEKLSVGKLRYRSVKVTSPEKVREIFDSSEAVRQQLGSANLEDVMSRNVSFIVQDEHGNRWDIGGVTAGRGGGASSGGGSGSRRDESFYGGQNAFLSRLGPVGGILYGSYLLQAQWSQMVQPVIAAGEQWAAGQASYAPFVYSGSALSETNIGYAYRKQIGDMYMGRAAYSQFGAYMDIPYRLSQTGNLSYARLLQAGGISLGVGLGGAIGGAMLSAAGATAAGGFMTSAAPVAAALFGVGALSMEGYNAYLKPSYEKDLTLSTVFELPRRLEIKQEALRRRTEALYGTTYGTPADLSGDIDEILAGNIAAADSYILKKFAAEVSGRNLVDLTEQEWAKKVRYNMFFGEDRAKVTEELFDYMTEEEKNFFLGTPEEREAERISSLAQKASEETTVDMDALRQALMVEKAYTGEASGEYLTELARTSLATGISPEQLMQAGVSNAFQLGMKPGTAEFRNQMLARALEKSPLAIAEQDYYSSQLARLGSQIQSNMGLSPEFLGLGQRLVAQYGLDNQLKVGAVSGIAVQLQQFGANLGVSDYGTIAGIAARVNPYVAGTISDLMSGLMANGVSQNAALSFGSIVSSAGMSNQDAFIISRIMAGDIGALSYQAWQNNNFGNAFFDQAGRPIIQHNGRIAMQVYNQWAPQFGGMALTGSVQQQIGQFLGTSNQGIISAFETGGIFGLQRYASQKSYEASMAGAGIQLRGIQLQEQFYWGSGTWDNPAPGSAWGIEDRQRAMAHASQMATFAEQWQRMQFSNDLAIQREQLQQRQMALTSQYQAYQWSMNYNLFQQQQGWAREDWQYQDTTRQLNFAWQMEDLEEAIRFSTGRERRKLIRQRDRAALSYNLEEEQIDTQRERQEELWAAQDERYRKEREYILETQRLEQENFNLNRKQRETLFEMDTENFRRNMREYEEERKLQEELQELQRKFQYDQLQLQKESAGVQAAAAATQKEINDALVEASEKWEKDVMGPLQETLKYNQGTGLLLALKSLAETIGNTNPAGVDKLIQFIKAIQNTSGKRFPTFDLMDYNLSR